MSLIKVSKNQEKADTVNGNNGDMATPCQVCKKETITPAQNPVQRAQENISPTPRVLSRNCRIGLVGLPYINMAVKPAPASKSITNF
jgi:hypothetical protein